jgi:dihydroneopterin aldolase
MDKVFIEGLDVDAVIGAYDWERSIRQRLRLDLEMAFDCRAAGASDALADALDYHRVATAVTALVEASQYALLEALAERVAAMLLADFQVTRVRVQIRKPDAVGNAAAVGVVIERSAAG